MTSRFRKWALSSPPAEWALNQIREILIGAVKQGPVPRHIAFVMDGNRRFARQNRIETVEGHNLGFEALARILEVCFKAGVECITVYAFSIENFKRSKYEVDALMDMAKIKLIQLAQHGELLDRYGARVRVIGQRDLLKDDVLEAIQRAEQITAHNTNCTLNICFPYTSREEITTGIRRTVEDYSKPIAPVDVPERNRRSAFKEERIANTIRSQHLSEHAEKQDTIDSPPSSRPHQRTSRPSRPSQPRSSSSSTTSLSTPDTTSEQDLDNYIDHETSSISSATTFHPETDSTTFSPPTETNTDESFSPRTKPIKLSSSTTGSKPTFPSPEQITPSTLNAHMYTASDPPLDLLIRTSGVARLSDFMLWQCHEHTHVVFLNILWPQFDLWNFLPVLWEWQWRARKAERLDTERDGYIEKKIKNKNNSGGASASAPVRTSVKIA